MVDSSGLSRTGIIDARARQLRNTAVHLGLNMDIVPKKYKNIPVQSLTVPRASDTQISRQWAHEGGKVVSPRQRPPLTHNKYFWYLFLLEVENLMSMKNFNDTIGN